MCVRDTRKRAPGEETEGNRQEVQTKRDRHKEKCQEAQSMKQTIRSQKRKKMVRLCNERQKETEKK